MFPVVVVPDYIGKVESAEGIWIVVDSTHSPHGTAITLRAEYAKYLDEYFSEFATVRLTVTCGSNSDVLGGEIKFNFIRRLPEDAELTEIDTVDVHLRWDGKDEMYSSGWLRKGKTFDSIRETLSFTTEDTAVVIPIIRKLLHAKFRDLTFLAEDSDSNKILKHTFDLSKRERHLRIFLEHCDLQEQSDDVLPISQEE